MRPHISCSPSQRDHKNLEKINLPSPHLHQVRNQLSALMPSQRLTLILVLFLPQGDKQYEARVILPKIERTRGSILGNIFSGDWS